MKHSYLQKQLSDHLLATRRWRVGIERWLNLTLQLQPVRISLRGDHQLSNQTTQDCSLWHQITEPVTLAHSKILKPCKWRPWWMSFQRNRRRWIPINSLKLHFHPLVKLFKKSKPKNLVLWEGTLQRKTLVLLVIYYD